MSSPDFFQKFLSAVRRRWADVIASDLAAGHDFEPELPASAFVQTGNVQAPRAVQPGVPAARQRSARMSTSNG